MTDEIRIIKDTVSDALTGDETISRRELALTVFAAFMTGVVAGFILSKPKRPPHGPMCPPPMMPPPHERPCRPDDRDRDCRHR